MPRDAELLSDMARELLRVARRPRVPAPPSSSTGGNGNEPGGDHNGNKTNGDGEDEPARAEKRKAAPRGFPVRRWSQMSKGYDAPEREYLAKRRRGLPPIVDGFNPIAGPVPAGVAGAQHGGAQQQQFRALKVRRVDADGRAHVYDVMAPVGAAVEGEISAEEAARITAGPGPAAAAAGGGQRAVAEPPAAPGTIIEGVGVVNAEGVVIAQPTPKRKPMPPRRKPKKGGVGRKPAQQPQQQTQQPVGAPENGAAPAGAERPAAGAGDGGAPGATAEGAGAGGGPDTPMHGAHGGEDEDDDEDEGEASDDEEEGSSRAMDDDDEHGGGASAGSTPGAHSARSVRFSDGAGGTPDAGQGTPGFVGSSLRTEVRLGPEPGREQLDAAMGEHGHHLGTMDNEPLADILAPPAQEELYGDETAGGMKMDDDDPFAPDAGHALAMARVPDFTMAGVVKDDDDAMALADDAKGMGGAASDAFFASAVDDDSAGFADPAPMDEGAMGGTPLTFPAMTHLDEEPGLDTPGDMSAVPDLSGFEQPLLQFDGTATFVLTPHD
jgi:hypothetical protein